MKDKKLNTLWCSCFFVLFLCENNWAQNIVIVGAGVSGLSAAHHLCKAGLCNITILEAQDHIGGRTHSVDFHGHILEEGAQWIHGLRGNPVYKFLAKTTSIPTERSAGFSIQNVIYRSSGNSTDEATRKLLFQSMGLYDAMSRYISRKRKMANLKNATLLSVAEAIWKKRQKGRSDLPSRRVLDAIFKYNMIELTFDGGSHPSDVGALAYDFYREFFGPDILVPGGYKTLLKLLTANIPESSIKLRKEVKTINWKRMNRSSLNSDDVSSQRVLLEYSNRNGNNDSIYADHVIVTVPLGYLKRHHLDLFRPSLPPRKQKVIDLLHFGTANKLFLYYEEIFWHPQDFPIHILWDSDVSVEEFGENFRIFKELNVVEVFKEQFILIWLNKPASDIIASLTDLEIGKTMTHLLRKIMKNDTIPYPDDTFVTRWGEKKYFLGSYSYASIGETLSTRRIARGPLVVNGVPRVLFAGEAMHKSRYSTVDGAFASGRNEARRLIRFLKGDSTSV